MSLKDIVPHQTIVKAGGKTFKVKGLSLVDLSRLIADHQEAMIELFGGKTPKWDKILLEFPEFAAKIVALAAGEEDQEKVVMALPVGVQLTALEAVWRETALDVDTVGKLLSNVIKGLEKLNLRMENVPDLKPGKQE